MAKINISIPQGTRDFNATVVQKRQFLFDTIKTTFTLYGYSPLETPAMENLETLMGKYGEEGDKLIFKILNNGIHEEKNIAKSRAAFENVARGKNDKDLTERALKYDLTIPFARYVAMNHAQLHFPYKRYQIQPVWRADRPQKGRYREFYQCDADVVGSTGLLNEIELICIYMSVFNTLNLPVTIKINNRKILAALAEKCGGVQHLVPITVAIDKLDKIGLAKVLEELVQKGLSESFCNTVKTYLSRNELNNNTDKLNAIAELLGEPATEGIAELNFISNFMFQNKPLPVTIDFTLARGLNYYTGTIIEVTANHVSMGSIGGGGRYDNLTGSFGVPGIPGVGISFGVDRIYDVLEELKLFPENASAGTKALFFNMGSMEAKKAFDLAENLRKKGIPCELYPETVKIEKQFKYAEKKRIPFVVIIGSKELEENTCTIKNLATGKQEVIQMDGLPVHFA
jgi:histidyl-tRNA synthetase